MSMTTPAFFAPKAASALRARIEKKSFYEMDVGYSMWKSARYNIYCSSFGRIALAEGSALCGLRGFPSIDRLLPGGGDLLGTSAAPEMAAFAYAHGPLGVALRRRTTALGDSTVCLLLAENGWL
jgi:hypothetical protein